MEPWQSWTIVGVLGVGGYWYYKNHQKPTRGRTHRPAAPIQASRRSSDAREESKGRKKKGKAKVADDGGHNAVNVADLSPASASVSGNEKASRRNGGKKQPSNLGQSSTLEVERNREIDLGSNEPGEEIDNKEFAKQMAGLKTGTSLKKADTPGDAKRTRKQGKQNESQQAPSNGKATEPTGLASPREISTNSSTTGADADDDLSPIASPGLDTFSSTPSAGGVADMLDAPSKGPSVLRLTQPAQPQPERQPKLKKAAPEPETKKQRQNKKKNEEKKAAREEAEKERRVLLEKQRRTAREAEGRPAKDGLSSMPPTTNAWSKPTEATTSNGSDTVESPNVNGSLLDTFDEGSSKSGTTAASMTNGSAANSKGWEKDIPSEEDQMRMLSEMDDDGWNTVEKGGKAKKKKAAPATTQEENAPVSAPEVNTNGNGPAYDKAPIERKKPSAINVGGSSKMRDPPSPMIGVVPPKFKTTKDQVDPKIWNRSNIHMHPEYDPEYPYALTGHPEDSDWAVV